MHTKIKILSSITYPHVVPNVYYEKYWNLKQSHKKSSKPALLCKFMREVWSMIFISLHKTDLNDSDCGSPTWSIYSS